MILRVVGASQRGRLLGAVTSIAALALLLASSGASAAQPILEFVTPGKAFPVAFTTSSDSVIAVMADFRYTVHCAASHGEGAITGPRTAVASYIFTGCIAEEEGRFAARCQTRGAGSEEITTGRIDAELVYIDQARHQVGILLDPAGGVFIAFECAREAAIGEGPFLSTVDPINRASTSFTAPLSESGTVQTPNEYENERGETELAIPLGTHGTANPLVPIGVDAAISVTPSVPVEVRAVSAAEVQARLDEEAAQRKQHEEAIQLQEAIGKLHLAEVANQRLQEENRGLLAARGRLEEEAHRTKSRQPTRAQLLARALRRCKHQPKRRRAKCVAKARRRYGPHRKH